MERQVTVLRNQPVDRIVILFQSLRSGGWIRGQYLLMLPSVTLPIHPGWTWWPLPNNLFLPVTRGVRTTELRISNQPPARIIGSGNHTIKLWRPCPFSRVHSCPHQEAQICALRQYCCNLVMVQWVPRSH